MKKVITYGTYDLLHQGHLNLLKRAKALGDYLIVGVTTDNFDYQRGKLNVRNNVMERIKSVEQTGLADQIIIEEYLGQKIDDILKYDVDIFAIGSDWEGKFDFLREYCEVIYLPRTQGISSTQLREESQDNVKFGIIGTGSIARRMVSESKFVSGMELVAVMNPDLQLAESFAKENNIEFFCDNIQEFAQKVNAAYIASPHLTHYPYAKFLLEHKINVLNELPFSLKENQAKELFEIAKQNKLVIMDAIKTAYCPAFRHLLSLVKTGIIGQIKDVEVAQSTLNPTKRKLDKNQAGGAITEDASFSLLPIFMLLGTDYKDIRFVSKFSDGVDIYTKCLMMYKNSTASFKIGLGIKTEGSLVISGTKGYIYVQSPWWKTSYFEARFEDVSQNQKFFYSFEGEGLRYELQEFISNIFYQRFNNIFVPQQFTIEMSKIQEMFFDRCNLFEIE